MKKHYILLLLLITFATANSQTKVITLRGSYFGYNLYVLNPLCSDGGFCVQEVLVNNSATKDEINSNSFEIDLSLLNLEIGDKVVVKIRHKKNCSPKIINTDDLSYPENFKFSSVKVKKGKLNFRIKGEPGVQPFEVQQFRWNKWNTIGEIDVIDTTKSNLYSYDIYPNYGINMFRIKKLNKRGEIVYSKKAKYRDPTKPEVFIKEHKIHNEIAFTDETEYEIYDLEGNFIKKGRNKYVDVTNLSKGKYWINYDNKTEQITKKENKN